MKKLEDADAYKLEFTGELAELADFKEEFLKGYEEASKNAEYLNETEFNKYVAYDDNLMSELDSKSEKVNSDIKAYNDVIGDYTDLFKSQNVKEGMIPEVIMKTAKGEYVIWDNLRTPDKTTYSNNCGHYLANRDRSYGKDFHYGEDILSNVGDLVFSPVAGNLVEGNTVYDTKYNKYKNNPNHKDYEKSQLERVAVNFGNNFGSAVFLYVKSADYLNIEKNKNGNIVNFPKVEIGQLLGISQDTYVAYQSKETPNHVHSQIGYNYTDKKTGKEYKSPDPKEYIQYIEANKKIQDMYKPLQDLYNGFNYK